MAESELKNYDNFVLDTSSTKKRAVKVAFKARRTFVRKGTIIICFLFLILGVCMIIFGAQIQQSNSQRLVKGQLAVSIIVIGVFVLLVGCTGVVGALMDHKGVVLGYQVLLGIFCIVQIVIVSLVLADSSNASSLVESAWNSASPETRTEIQYDFNCCGLWGINLANTTTELCSNSTLGGTVGCSDKIVSDLKSEYWPAGFICIVLVLAEVAGLIFGCWMICGKKEAAASDLQSKRKRKQEELTNVTVDGEKKKEKKTKKKKEKSGDLR